MDMARTIRNIALPKATALGRYSIPFEYISFATDSSEG
jgi:hypothetical protein